MSDDSKNRGTADHSRRTFLKNAVAGLLAGAATQLLPGLSSASAAEKSGQGKKVLVVYYSRSGNTREIANQIHMLVGGDIVELQTVNPYPTEYRATTEQAKQELQSGYRPPLKTKISNIASFDIIIVGSPCWWGTFAMPVWTCRIVSEQRAPAWTGWGAGGSAFAVRHVVRCRPLADLAQQVFGHHVVQVVDGGSDRKLAAGE